MGAREERKEFLQGWISGRCGNGCEECYILGPKATCFGRGFSKLTFTESHVTEDDILVTSCSLNIENEMLKYI
jgi:hypothetical protein